MPNLNKVMLMGHLTKDIELRYTPDGMAIANFTLAVNTKRKEKNDEVYFANITAFSKTAEVLETYLTKGSPLYIEGRLQRQTWETDGTKKSKDVIIVNTFQFLGIKKDTKYPEENIPIENPF